MTRLRKDTYGTFTLPSFRSATRFTLSKLKGQAKEWVGKLTCMADSAIADRCCTLAKK